jgi:AcrR family transcriptional regulator
MQRARTTSGSFYHFFPTKEDLVLAVVDHIGNGFDTAAFAADPEEIRDPIDRVFEVLESHRRDLEDSDFALGSPLGTLAAELSASHPQVRERLAGLYTEWIDRMQRLLEAAGDRFPAELDRRTLAEFILSTVEGAVLQARVRRSMAPFDGAVADLRRYLGTLAPGRRNTATTEKRPRPIPASAPAAADWRAW